MASLQELQAKFLRRNADESSNLDEQLEGAHGIIFLCPKCFAANGNSDVGVHSIICWFEGVPPNVSPGPGRWVPKGTGLGDLTFITDKKHPLCSVLLTSGCKWHGHVVNGHAK